MRPRCWLPVLPPPAAAAPAIPPSLPACLPPSRACRLPLSPSSPGAGCLFPGTAWPGKEPDSSRLAPGRCRREQSHPAALHPWRKGNAAPDTPRTRLARGSWQGRSAAPAMPHFLDWFVPVYLMISILILVGFGACIYYFEPGLQEAHKWRTQRPIMERDLRKTLMIRDNLAFGVPEV
ncbi:small integral membrane protein 45 [Melospiza georgiana]|uniref:small integral membrane protein 45 n=1 Tax=Melospiza georgiana TaxID=44398 RepID=UPI0025ACFA28|nr:small integral membrane protein 45 [Melospiza georgiana]